MDDSNIPDDPLSVLDTNLKDILSNLTHLHGIEYSTKVAAMFALTEQIDQLEMIACDATRLIADNHPMGEMRDEAEAKHSLCHMLATNIKVSVDNTLSYYCTLDGYAGFARDVQLLRDRAHTDYHSKIRYP